MMSSRTRTAMKGEGSAMVSMENHLYFFLVFFLFCLCMFVHFTLAMFSREILNKYDKGIRHCKAI